MTDASLPVPDRPPIPSFDPVRYKAEQRLGWGRVAEGWSRWWETFERAAQPVSDRLVALAAIGPGQSVLDVGTGIGEPAATAARRVGPAGRVVAVDQAAPMLEVARRRLAALGLDNVDLREMDAESLDLRPATFDAILSRWGLMFLPDLSGALARMRDLLRPGGRLAAATWGPAERVPMIATAGEVFRRELGLAPPPDAPHPCALSDEVALHRTLEEAGFVEPSAERMTVTFELASPEEYARFVREISAAAQAIQNEPPARQAQIWHALAEAARRYADLAGRVVMSNEALLISAKRPDASTMQPDLSSVRPDASPVPAAPSSNLPSSSHPRAVRCPFCGGDDTRLESLFGSTLGFAQYWCASCRTVFEYLKWEEEHPTT